VKSDEGGQHSDDGLTVDATFEECLHEIEAAAAAYLSRPLDDNRAALQTCLERLDEQIEQSEAFDANSRLTTAFGSVPRFAIVGDTTEHPVVEQVLAAEFTAQVALVRAAKDEVRDPSPRSLEALRSASAALLDVRSRE
jgi:hypothetical protein